MPDSVVDQAYLERPGASGSLDFVHLTLRMTLRDRSGQSPDHSDRSSERAQARAGSHAVEEVVGTVDQDGKRTGEILSIVADTSLEEAQATFTAQITSRQAAGFQRIR